MQSYKYTDKLLSALAIFNILMFIPFVRGMWGDLNLYFFAQGGDGTQLLMNILLSAVQWLVISIFTTWAFFKRWRLVLPFYMVYLIFNVPISIYILIYYWKQNNSWNFLESTINCYLAIFLWLLALITFIVMLIETDYGNLQNKWRRWAPWV